MDYSNDIITCVLINDFIFFFFNFSWAAVLHVKLTTYNWSNISDPFVKFTNGKTDQLGGLTWFQKTSSFKSVAFLPQKHSGVHEVS